MWLIKIPEYKDILYWWWYKVFHEPLISCTFCVISINVPSAITIIKLEKGTPDTIKWICHFSFYYGFWILNQITDSQLPLQLRLGNSESSPPWFLIKIHRYLALEQSARCELKNPPSHRVSYLQQRLERNHEFLITLQKFFLGRKGERKCTRPSVTHQLEADNRHQNPTKSPQLQHLAASMPLLPLIMSDRYRVEEAFFLDGIEMHSDFLSSIHDFCWVVSSLTKEPRMHG